MKDLFKLFLSIVLISSRWWTFAILEYFGKTNHAEYQILLILPFTVLWIFATIIGTVILVYTFVKIFKIQDKKII